MPKDVAILSASQLTCDKSVYSFPAIYFSTRSSIITVWICSCPVIFIQSLNLLHFMLSQGKIENIRILFYPFICNCFWYSNDFILYVPSQNHLGSGFVILLPNLF